MRPRPLVSVIIPAYHSHQTIGRCLQSLEEQTYSPFEAIVVDSSPDEQTSEIVGAHYPAVKLIRSREHLLPHAARNRGAQDASGECFVFTDPDIYPAPDWLEIIVGAYQQTGQIIVGAVGCYGSRWIDVGNHLCKFDKWLPGGKPRLIDVGPSGNILYPRAIFEQQAGFPSEGMLGDTLLSWTSQEGGHSLCFEPTAVVYHHHLSNWPDLLRERYHRGAEFGRLRAAYHNWSFPRILLHLLITLLPLRLAKLVARVGGNARRAGLIRDFLITLPLTISGEAAWLIGEASSFSRLLTEHQRAP